MRRVKMKRILAYIMIGVLCISSLTGCKGTEGSGKDTVTDVLLYDFEDYDRNFQLMRVMSYFGAVDVNEDAQYVKSGTTSALLQPLGYHSTMRNNTFTGLKAESCLYLPLSSGKFEFDYSNSAKIREISMAMYNANEEDVPVYVSLIYEKNAVTLSDPVEFVLEPGWNDVFYVPDYSLIAMKNDLQSCYGIALSFERAGSRERQDAPKIYLDDVRLKVSETEAVPETEITLAENEVCDFEQLYQEYVMQSSFLDKALRPDMKVVTAADYGIAASSGRRVLRVVLKPTDCIDGTIYDGIYLTQAVMDAVGFQTLEDSDRFCFDLYNDSDVVMDLPITFRTTKDSGYKVCHFYVSPKQWTTFRIRMDDLDALWEEDERTYRDNPGEIHLEWGEFTGDERVFYLDNFRIER